MASPDPEGFSLLAKVVAAGGAVLAPVGWLWAKLEKKADKHAVASQFQTVTSELTLQRSHIAKLFDKLAEAEERGDARHREILMHLLEKK